MVEQLVKQQIEEDRWYRGGRNYLTPKPAKVVDFDDELNVFGLQIGREFTMSGEGFLPVNTLLGRRTVFWEKPVMVGGTAFYLEAKGYGRNGQELYPHIHKEGDLYFGMFLDCAKREFYQPKFLRLRGIENIQKSVAVLQFGTPDFVKYSAQGLALVISAGLQFSAHQERLTKALDMIFQECDQVPDEYFWHSEDELGKKVAGEFLKVFQTGGVAAVKEWAKRCGLLDELGGITCGREFGYVLRAVKSPIRVGDLHDKSIVTEGNKQIAKQVGRTVRQMLELGFWHTSPNPGNWTTEGELVDFEDVIKYPEEASLIGEDMYLRRITALGDYVEFTFGNGTVGHLSPEFQEGFMGSKTSTRKVVKTTLGILGRLSIPKT